MASFPAMIERFQSLVKLPVAWMTRLARVRPLVSFGSGAVTTLTVMPAGAPLALHLLSSAAPKLNLVGACSVILAPFNWSHRSTAGFGLTMVWANASGAHAAMPTAKASPRSTARIPAAPPSAVLIAGSPNCVGVARPLNVTEDCRRVVGIASVWMGHSILSGLGDTSLGGRRLAGWALNIIGEDDSRRRRDAPVIAVSLILPPPPPHRVGQGRGERKRRLSV